MKQISSALVKAQKAFNPALKSSLNPHFKSKYVSLDGCIEAVIDALNDNGVMLMQETSECESGVTVETVFIHESGEERRAGKLHVPASKNDAQGYGSALTYARRYSLMAACGIAPEDDDGNAASQPVKQASKQVQPKNFDIEITKLKNCTTIEQLAKVWGELDAPSKHVLESVKNEQKQFIESVKSKEQA